MRDLAVLLEWEIRSRVKPSIDYRLILAIDRL
jgi:hypothetical protein